MWSKYKSGLNNQTIKNDIKSNLFELHLTVIVKIYNRGGQIGFYWIDKKYISRKQPAKLADCYHCGYRFESHT